MNRPTILALALAAAAALSAPAETRVAAVDFNIVYLAHPQTPKNRAELLAMQGRFVAQRDARLAEVAKTRAALEAAAAEAADPVQGAAVREKAAARARDLHAQYKKEGDEVEDFVAGLRRQLQRREFDLFRDVTLDIRAKTEEIAKAKGFDFVVDKAAASTSAGVPTPVFLFVSDAVDVTDDVIAAIGGSREQAEKDQAALFGIVDSDPDDAAPAADAPAPAAPAAPDAAPAATEAE